MKNQPLQKVKRKISPSFIIIIVILIIISIPIIFIASTQHNSNSEYDRLNEEITRIESLSGVSPLSVSCRMVVFSETCDAKYLTLNYEKAKHMLIVSGYGRFSAQSTTDITAHNETSDTSVRSSTLGEEESGKITILSFEDNYLAKNF